MRTTLQSDLLFLNSQQTLYCQRREADRCLIARLKIRHFTITRVSSHISDATVKKE